MSIRKRIMAMILAVIMVMSVLPMSALAEELKSVRAEKKAQTVYAEGDNGEKILVSDSGKQSVTPITLDDYKVWDTFEFGRYPQTKVTDSKLIAELNKESPRKNGYYRYKAEDYAKVSGNYYKVEPIVWRVAKYYDDNSIIIMTDNVIDCRVFNETSSNLSWETSSLRKWLNEDFYDIAFSAGEKTCIKATKVDNSAKGNMFDYSTPNTEDKVFLFSHGELTDSSYNFNTNDTYDDPQRRSASTQYAQAMGAGSGYCNYWTRSYNSSSVVYVLTGDGCVGSCHDPVAANSTGYGVRPVMVTDKDSGFFKSINKIGESITATFYDISSSALSVNVHELNDDKKYNPIRGATVSVISGKNADTYKTNNTGKAEIKLPEVDGMDRISFHVTGFYDYIAPAETFTESQKNIKLKKLDKDRNKPYVSTVFVRESGYALWDSGKTADSESNVKYDVVVSAGWGNRKPKQYVLSQDEKHSISSTTGVFKDIDIAKTFKEGSTIYAYCIAQDGTRSPAFKTGIEVKATGLGKVVEKEASVSLLGKNGLSYKLNEDIPVFGGSEVNFNWADVPVGVIIDGDNVKLTVGLTLYENKSSSSLNKNASLGDICTNGKTVKDNYDDLKDYVKQIDTIGDAVKQIKEDNNGKYFKEMSKKWKEANNYYTHLNTLRKNLGQKSMSGRIIGKQSVNIDVYGYWEGKFYEETVDNVKVYRPVTKDCGLALKVDSESSYSHMYLLGSFPTYSCITGKIELNATATKSRPVADSSDPLEFELSFKVEPSLEAALGVGIPKYLGADISGTGSMPITYESQNKYLKADLTASVDVNFRAWLFTYKLNLAEKTWNLVSESFAKKSAQRLNSMPALSEDMFTTLAPRNECKWVSGSSSTPPRLYSYGNCGLSSMTLQKDACKSEIQTVAANGVKLAVLIQDVKSRPSADRTQVSYSVIGDKSSTTPKPVDNSDLLSDTAKTADFLPSAVASGKNIYIAWQNTKKALGDIPESELTVDKYSQYAEICVAKYNTETGKMSDTVTLTNDTALDTLPVVVANSNGGATVVWVSNSAASFFQTEGTNSIKYCTISSDMKVGAVKTVATGIHPIQNIDAIYNGSNLLIATAQDTNNNPNDNTDMEIFQYTVNSLGTTTAQRLSNNNTVDSNPIYKRNKGLIQLFWYEDQNLRLKNTFEALHSASRPITLMADEDEDTGDKLPGGMLSDDYDVAYNENGQGYFVWCQPVDGHVELFGSYFDGETWSSTFQISHLEQKLSDPSIICNEDGSLTVLCNRTSQTLVQGENLSYWQSGETDMVMLTYVPGPDLGIDSLMVFDEAQIKPGDTVSIPLTVNNNGMACDGFVVSINGQQVYTHSKALGAGESVDVAVDYTYPDKIEHTKLTIQVESADGKEINPNDNSTELEYGFANLKISEVSVDDYSESAVLGLSVGNMSNIDAGESYLTIYEKDADGQCIGTTGFNGMEGWHYGSYTVNIDKNLLDFDENGSCVLYVELVDKDGNVIDTETAVVNKHIYKGTSCSVIDTAVSGNTATVIGVIDNDTNDYAQGYFTVSAVDSNGKVVASKRQFICIAQQINQSFEVALSIPEGSTVAEYKAEFDDCGRLLDYYETDDGTVTIEKYYGNTESFEIPDEINGIPVTKLGDDAFAKNKALKHILIPESVVSIGNGAFRDDSALEEIKLGTNVAFLGEDCYAGCESVKSVSVAEGNKIVFAKDNILYAENGERLVFASSGAPAQMALDSKVKTIDKNAFAYHKNLEKIEFNNGLEKIGERAFADSTKLKTIAIPDSVTTMGIYAFKGCTGLVSVDIGDGLKQIGIGAFADCTGLKKLTIGESVVRLGRNSFADCVSLEQINLNAVALEQLKTTQTAFVNAGKNSGGITVNIGKNVTAIPAYFFNGTGKYAVPVKTLDVGYAKLSIGENAFANVATLEEILYSENIAGIGVNAFANCTKLRSIDLHTSKMTKIADGAFSGCSALESVSLPASGITEIGSNAFSVCAKLKDFSIPESVVTIGAYAFNGCSGLSEINLGEKLTFVEYGAFRGCTGVKTVRIDCAGVTFADSVFANLGTASTGTVVVIGDDVPAIPANLFAGDNKITEVYIGSSVKNIGNYAFNGNSALRQITGCRSVETVGSYAFANCTMLTSIPLGDKVWSIGDYAFNNCRSLKTIELSDKIERLPAGVFNGCSSLENPVMPAELKSIGEKCFYGCAKIAAIDLPDTLASIGKEAFRQCSGIEHIAIPDGVKNLGAYAFAENTSLKKAEIGAGIETLTDFVFFNDSALESIECKNPNTQIYPTAIRGCTKLTQLPGYKLVDGILYNDDQTELVGALNSGAISPVIPDTVTKICDEAFSGCRIDSIVIPDSVTDIGDRAFYNCGLKTLELGRSVMRIGELAFYGNTQLTKLELPNSLRSIGSDAFNGLSLLTELVIPDSVETIGDNAFYGCSSVSQLTLGERVSSIGNNAFYRANRVQTLTIPNSVKTIGSSAFMGMVECTEISVGKGVESIGDNAFESARKLTKLSFNAENCADFKLSANPFYYAGYDSKSLTVEFGDSVKRIPGYFTYYSNTNLRPYVTDIRFGSAIEEIGPYAFFDLDYVTWSKLSLPKLKSVGEYAMYSTSISGIELPESQTIGNFAFGYCTEITEVKLPDSMTSVGSYAFSNCSAIKSFDFGNGKMSIGEYALTGCNAITSLTLGEGIQKIGHNAFYSLNKLEQLNYNITDCPDLPSGSDSDAVFHMLGTGGSGVTMNVGKNVERIPAYLFYPYRGNASYAHKIVELNIAAEDIQIGESAFSNCTSLKSVTANNISFVGESAFSNCTSLKSVTANNISFAGRLAFNNCPIDSFTGKLCGDIEDYAFSNTGSLTGLTLENGITSIGQRAFASSKITEVNIPDSVRSVGSYAFSGCTAITSLTLGEGIQKIGYNAFYNLNKLTQLNYNITDYTDLPSGGDSNEVFYMLGTGGNGVTMNVGKNVERIPAYLFYPYRGDTYYANKIVELNIAAEDIQIGTSAFNGCISLRRVTANNISFVGRLAFNNCPIDSFTGRICGDIADYAFSSTGSLTGLTLENGITSIGQRAFASSKIAEINIPDSVKSVGSYAFSSCNAITSLTLGEGIQTIGHNAFYNLNKLEQLNYNVIDYPDLPSGSDSYAVFYMLGAGGNGVTVNVGKNVERIPAYLFYPYRGDTYYANKIVELNIAAEDIQIGTSAFNCCTSLKSVTANNISFVGRLAFNNCPIDSFAGRLCGDIKDNAFSNTGSLTGMTLENGITSIDQRAFASSKITEVNIPDSVRSVGSYAFNGCTGITSLTLGEGIQTIGYSAFGSLNKLEQLNYNITNYPDLPSSNDSDAVFYMLGTGGSGVTVNIGDNVERIPAYLFYPSRGNTYYANKIVAVNCGKGLESIGRYAFYCCTSLEALSLNESIKTIGQHAFNNTALTGVNVPKNTEIDAYALGFAGNSVKSGFKLGGFAGGPAEAYAANAKISWSDLAPMADEIGKISFAEGDSGSIYAGETLVLHEITSPTNNIFPAIKWSSSDSSVATVDKNGVVLGVKAGNATIIAKAANGTEARFALTVNKGMDISGARLVIDEAYAYTGAAITPSVKLVFKGSVIPAKYYTVTYDNNTDIGTATVTVTAQGKYLGSFSGSFEIVCSHPGATAEIITASTCTKHGKARVDCPLCGVVEEELPLAEHIAGEWIVDTPATVSSEGAQHRECVNCGTVLDNAVIPAIVDNTPPTGTVTIDDSAWSDFISAISFGIISSNSKQVTITAQDESSGVASVEYFVSDTPLTQSRLEAAEAWTVYEKPFTIDSSDGKRAVVYARITDNGGNVALISSDGIVFDCTAPTISGVEDAKVYCISAEFTVTDDNLAKITIDGESVDIKNAYVIDSAGKHTVTATDKAGNVSQLSFTVNEDHFSGAWVIDKAATETENGVRHLECESCGKVMFTERYKYTDTEVGYCKHECSPERIDATCTQGGYTKYTCVKCGFSYIADKSEPLGHIEVTDSAVAPTYTETGLTEGSHCRVCGEVLRPQKTVPMLELDRPSITAERNDNGRPTLAWNAIDGAAKYELWVSEGTNDKYVKLCTTQATEYVHDGASAGMLYYYKVKAITAIDTAGDFGNEAFVLSACEKPVVTVSAVASSGKPKLTWPAVEGASKYEVWRATSKNGKYSKLTTTTSTSCTNTSAKPGTAYYYKVKAICAKSSYGDSEFSAIKGMTCDCAQPVVKLSIVASSGKPKLTWAKVEGASKYEVWRATSKSGKYSKLTTTTSTSCTNTSAKPGTAYYYKVKAICAKTSGGNSAFSAIKGATCDCARPALKITTSGGKPKLTWAKVEGASKYEIWRATSKNGKYSKLTTTSAISYINKNAKAGTTYYYKVKAICAKTSNGNSAYSSVVSVRAK